MKYAEVEKTTFFASDLISLLIKGRLIKGMRYRGSCEYLVWGLIPRSAVLRDFSFAEVRELGAAIPSVTSILRLNGESDKDIRTTRGSFIGSPIVLDCTTAPAIGHIAVLFALGLKPTANHVTNIVMQILNSFVVRPPSGVTNEQLVSLAILFVEGLYQAARSDRLSSEKKCDEIVNGFLKGLSLSERLLEVEVNRPPSTSYGKRKKKLSETEANLEGFDELESAATRKKMRE
jgi:hypothetical protein